jgi:hypothetical protein
MRSARRSSSHSERRMSKQSRRSRRMDQVRGR